jgi:hypothetical protein
MSISMDDLPDIAKRALEAGEIVKWIGKPARMPNLLIWFFRVVYGFLGICAVAVILDVGIPLIQGETPMYEGKPVTLKSALPSTLLFVGGFGGFWFLYKWNFGKYRYIVTDRRAFHYRPIWGASWRWVKSEGFKRNYDDPEYSPISGGYFTNETTVSKSGFEDYGIIEIGPLQSSMDDAQKISVVKKILPALDNIIYDPSNLDFHEVENPALAEKEINSILRKFKNEQTR